MCGPVGNPGSTLFMGWIKELSPIHHAREVPGRLCPFLLDSNVGWAKATSFL